MPHEKIQEEQQMVLFTNLLRNQGMLVSIRTTQMAMMVLRTYKTKFSEKEFYHALKSIYVKDMGDEDKFNKAFNEMFANKIINERRQNRASYMESSDDNIFSDNSLKKQEDNFAELIETIKEDKEETKTKVNKISQNSLILLDGYDPKVYETCKRLSKKVANNRSMRRKKSNKQHINMSMTIRSNMRYGGHILNIVKDKPPMKKNRHIFLCDISGSCEWITSWFFAIIYGCQKTFNRIRVFDFDNKIIEVTDALNQDYYKSIGEINMAHRKFGGNPYGQSDMTKSFKEVLKTVELNKRTDIIILTDCRDWKGKRENGVLESATILKEISQKVHKIMILNPEKKIRWNNATSCVKDYEKIGIPVYEAGTLDQFARIISKL